MEKDLFGDLLHFHSDSRNMNDTELNFNGIVKLNTERPPFGNETLLSQVCETYEN